MSSTVCQGLQTCLEPGLVEQRAMAQRLVSPKPHLFHRTESQAAAAIAVSAPNTTEQQCCNKYTDQKDLGTFASVYSLINTSKQSYDIQPLRIRSLPTSLSKRSLELCTENLGCETGTDLINTDFSCHSSCSSNPNSIKPSKQPERVKLRQNTIHRKENSGSFPRPLTSISGQSSVHMKAHREGGRLVLKAVTVPSTHACLQAERRDGRLRLHLVNRNSRMEAAGDDSKAEEEGEETEGKLSKNGSIPTEAATKEEGEEAQGRGGGACLGNRRRNGKDGRNGNENDERGEIGIGKYQMPGRCKKGGHGNKGPLNWEPFWVASS